MLAHCARNTILCGSCTCHRGRPPQGPLSWIFLLSVLSLHNEHDSPRCSIPPQGPFSRICFLVFLALHTTNTILCGFYTCHWGRPPQGPLSRFFFYSVFVSAHNEHDSPRCSILAIGVGPRRGHSRGFFFSGFGSAHNEHNSLRFLYLPLGQGATLAFLFLCF